MFIALKLFEVPYLNLIGQSQYSYQTLTKLQRGWRVVKIGHQDLILTTSLKASGRFQTKGELRPNEVRNLKYDHIQLKDVAMYLYKHIII